MKLVPYSKWMYGAKWTVPINVALAFLNLWLFLFVTYSIISLIAFLFSGAIAIYLYWLGTEDVT